MKLDLGMAAGPSQDVLVMTVFFPSQKLAYKTHQWRFVEGGLIGRATEAAEKKAGAKRS